MLYACVRLALSTQVFLCACFYASCINYDSFIHACIHMMSCTVAQQGLIVRF